ncbi:MAG: hypothetical protein KJO82_08825, partial [Gammaproteobacteria bacterium]|nr:hypothetical protein [Gammaproteobacteria bacterium]
VYEESVDPKVRAMGCGSARMGAAFDLQAGEMLRWRRKPPRGYVLYMQIGLAAAVDSGHPKGPAAWQRWLDRANPRDPNRSPEWSILPRSLYPRQR